MIIASSTTPLTQSRGNSGKMQVFRWLCLPLAVLWIVRTDCKCPDNKVSDELTSIWEYWITHDLCIDHPNTLPTTLSTKEIVYYGNVSTITATINDSLSTNSSNFSYLFFYVQRIPFRNFPIYIDCIDSPANNVTISTDTWDDVGNFSVYVITSDDEDARKGCDFQNITVGNFSKLNVSVSLRQEDLKGPYKVGNITIIIHSNKSKKAEKEYKCAKLSEPVDCFTNRSLINETHDYLYTIYYQRDENITMCSSNRRCIHVKDHYFSKTNGTTSIFVEVTKKKMENEILRLAYGKNLLSNITVLDPIGEASLKIGGDYNYVKENITISLSVGGSTPITAKWNVTSYNDSNDLSFYCQKTQLVIQDEGDPSSVLHCMFNISGKFQFNFNMSNHVSCHNVSYPFDIHELPPINVVATSTTAIAILIVIIIIIVICIILVATYIPYRRFKNKNTETADFNFVDLKKPSRWEKYSDKLKEKFKRDKGKVGLVNTDDMGIDSFYGSLNPFAAHETL